MTLKHRTWSVSLESCLLLLPGLAGWGFSYQVEDPAPPASSFSASGQTTRIDTSALTESEKLAAQRLEVSSGPKIIVDDRAGSITVTAGNDGAVTLDAEKRADSQNALTEIQVTVSKRNDEVYIGWAPETKMIVNRVVHFAIKAPEVQLSSSTVAMARSESSVSSAAPRRGPTLARSRRIRSRATSRCTPAPAP
jgi:hypothetical protein